MFEKRLQLSIESNFIVKPYKVVIVDLNMPDMNGFEVVEKIRGLCEANKPERVNTRSRVGSFNS